MKSPDKLAVTLANDIRKVNSEHMSKFEASEYAIAMSSVVMGMYLELARLKELLVSTEEVSPENFDKVLIEGINKHYEDHKDRSRNH